MTLRTGLIGSRSWSEADEKVKRGIGQNCGMQNLAATFKAEIARVARKQVRAEIAAVVRASSEHRKLIAALRRQVKDLEARLVRSAAGAPASSAQSTADTESGAPRRRFSAFRLAAHRSKLGISAEAYGRLLGVTGQTVYKWEKGAARPRSSQLEALASVRGLPVRELRQRVALLQAE